MDLEQLRDLEARSAAGDADAAYQLGKRYLRGEASSAVTVPKDRARATELLQVAAAKGHTRATIRTGRLPSTRALLRSLMVTGDRLIDRVEALVKSTVVVVVVGVVAVTLLGLVAAGAWLGVSALAALPVSAAIIIGAVIIASSRR